MPCVLWVPAYYGAFDQGLCADTHLASPHCGKSTDPGMTKLRYNDQINPCNMNWQDLQNQMYLYIQ